MPGQQQVFLRKATIAVGAVQSDTIDLNGMVLCGIETPATVAGANLTFKSTRDRGGLMDVYDQDGTATTSPMGASRIITITPQTFAGLRTIALVSDVVASGSAEIYWLLLRAIE